ncbi:porin family protein [Prevotella sp. KH2C16]|uniref:porin family protein n=1 Tax=Prevotella sp. KH2C16 TaxID=1855325 RepID=UPI0008E39F8D|nr:porin family protein [Prevotella sp. KH2C16]SFF97644.1 Outer membrane protein beta-barrel domain-containing protein [Prevotella sp. KH2C16]
MKRALLYILFLLPVAVNAQIGEHRNDFSIGVNGGYALSNISFTPEVPQKMHGGITGGLSFRYVCEKYFKTIASVYAEVNYASIGWKENILTREDQPVINAATGVAEKYSRTINYIQIPVMAHLAWGKEDRGFNFFLNLGPQFGMYLSESTSMNFDLAQRNIADRATSVVAQDTMAVENKFDYGIALGIGTEYSIPRAGHILLEARYYYGLGNIYGDTKKDYFGSSNFGNILVKLTYLFDITRTKKNNH